jgi:predicted amidophosphoribosyltransferase
VFDLLFPVRCGICRVVGPSPCARCAGDLRAAGDIPVPSGLDTCVALLEYAGAGRALIASIKYRNHRASITTLACALACLPLPPVDEVTWAPMSARRRRRRGFDQAEVLARALAAQLGSVCRPRLRRRTTAPQTGQSMRGRLGSPVFVARPSSARASLVVDDVVTTGATLSAAATALRAAGSSEVHGVALARTPAPGGRPAPLKPACTRAEHSG